MIFRSLKLPPAVNLFFRRSMIIIQFWHQGYFRCRKHPNVRFVICHNDNGRKRHKKKPPFQVAFFVPLLHVISKSMSNQWPP